MFFATSNTFDSITNQLLNYESSSLASIRSAVVNTGACAVLPENAAITNSTWVGNGYFMTHPKFYAAIIGGDYHGGYAGDPGVVDASGVSQNATPWFVAQTGDADVFSWDPVRALAHLPS